MSPEERREVTEICAKTDQWVEEILAHFMEWTAEGKVGHAVSVLATRVNAQCPLESLLGIFGLIGIAKVMEICARRAEEAEEGEEESE